MDRFSRLNPKVSLLFFIFQIIITIAVFNPILLGASLLFGAVYKLITDGKGALRLVFSALLPLVLLVTLFNFAFTHYGETVLFTVLDMRFTLESLFYGFTQGLLLGAVLIWISAYSATMTADGLLSVLGGLTPDIALVFSMVLSFLPRLRKNVREIGDARLLYDNEVSTLKRSINNFSALITLTLEESIDLSDSMRARGYNKKRTVYSRYRFSSRDLLVLLIEILLFALTVCFQLSGKYSFVYEPEIILGRIPPLALTPYLLLSLLPTAFDLTEDIKWFILKQKI